MGNFIEASTLLGYLCVVHLFLIYADAMEVMRGAINRKVINCLFLAELFAVTIYVIVDNLQTPIQGSLFWAIVGYGVVYGLIFGTWKIYLAHNLLEKGKVYVMSIMSHALLNDESYVLGMIVTEDGKEVEVLLPYEEKYLSPEAPQRVKVKFKTVISGMYIVTAV